MASRGWSFVVNNFTLEECQAIDTIDCVYMIVGIEGMDEGKTPHLQGYVYFANRGKRLRGVKALPGMARAHLEPAMGSPEQNRVYCSKEGNFTERGVLPQAGKRTDIDVVKKVIRETGRMRDVIEVASSYQAMKAGELMLKYAPAPERPDVQIYWYWGPTGTGKTHTACEEAGGDYWMSSRNLKWWDGYDGEANVIVDDYRTSFCSWAELLRITDKRPFRVETKGGSRPLLARRIWFTTPENPVDTWRGQTGEELGQLLRRITLIREFRGVPQGVPEVGGNTEPRPEEEKKEG